MKRFFDIFVAVAACLVLALPMLLVAILVKLTSRGPVLYWSDRVGQDNRIFSMPKFRSMKTGTPAVATHLLTDSGSHLTPIGGLLRERGDAISHHIEQHLLMLAPEERSLERVAEAFHCSVSTLRRRLAREQTGFRELLDKVQLGLALDQLQASSLPIADIASACGYDSPSRFAMRFRQHYGISPSELRQTLA